MPTTAQTRDYNLHRGVCQSLGAPQSTLRHFSLAGTISGASATGNTRYTGPGATSARTYTATPVWAVWQPQLMRSASDPEVGREGQARQIAQMPAIDDDGNLITLAHDDSLIDSAGHEYRILNPAMQPDGGFYTFELLKRR